MIEEYAIITEVADNQATLEIERRTACGLCGQTRGCGNATWGKLLGHKSHAFNAENPINAKIGDSVVVGINEKAILSSVFFLYVIPLLGLLIGAVAADMIFKNQFYVLLSATSGLIIGFLWVKGHLAGHGKGESSFNEKYQAIILRHANDIDEVENNVVTNDAEAGVSKFKFQTKRGE